MQPSTWKHTNQHWTPQFLLKGFGIRSKSSRIYQLDKQTKELTLRRVKDVASKPGLATHRDDNLMHNIENHATEAVRTIRKGHLNQIDEKSRQAVDRLVCSMLLNDPYSGANAKSERDKVIAESVRELSQAVKRGGGVPDQDYFERFLSENMSHDWLSGFMVSESNRISPALQLMGLRIYGPADGAAFIIGDSPVSVIHNTVGRKTNLLDPSARVIAPIGSRCALVYSWTADMNVIGDGGTLSNGQVQSLNSDYYHGTECRYIYGRNEETLRRSHLLPLTHVPFEHPNEVRSGWFIMQHLDHFMHRQKQAHRAARVRARENAAREFVATTI